MSKQRPAKKYSLCFSWDNGKHLFIMLPVVPQWLVRILAVKVLCVLGEL